MALDQAFDAGTLHLLRKAVLAEAEAAGMSRDRAEDVMLAVHELAANAVRHGPGTGMLRMHTAAGQLRCQVSDAGVAGTGHPDSGNGTTVDSWPFMAGHGLWLVRRLSDQVSVLTSQDGSQATAVFALPGQRAGAARG